MALLCFFAFLTGFGGCSAFSASIKTGISANFGAISFNIDVCPAASNFPDHRGTATAFPLAAFGLSAFFWSTISTLIFKDDTGRFLLLLALGTSLLTVASTPLLRILPPSDPYFPISQPRSTRVESRRLHRTRSSETHPHAAVSDEAGTHSTTAFESQPRVHARSQSSASNPRPHPQNPDHDETSSLVSSKHGSRPSQSSLDNHDDDDDDALSDAGLDSPHPDIRGLAMLPKPEFWQLFLTMALLSGIGLMTIKYFIFCPCCWSVLLTISPAILEIA